jgi:hypothetical protein
MAKDGNDKPTEEGQDHGPLLDMSQAAVRKMIATAKSRGYITSTSSTRSCRPTRSRPSRSRT